MKRLGRQVADIIIALFAGPLFVPAWLVAFIAKLLWHLVRWGVGAIRLGLHKGWNTL